MLWRELQAVGKVLAEKLFDQFFFDWNANLLVEKQVLAFVFFAQGKLPKPFKHHFHFLDAIREMAVFLVH